MDQSTNNFVSKLVSNGKWAWTGGVKLQDVWHWYYLSAKINWFNWASGQPDNAGGKESFIQINSNGQWNDAPNTHKKGFVCEYVHT